MHLRALILFSVTRGTTLRASLALAVMLAISTRAEAQFTWTGVTPGFGWGSINNWSTGTIPDSSTADVSFTGNALGAVNIFVSVSARSLSFTNPTGSYTLTSSANQSLTGVNAINVGSGVTGTQTINLANIAGGSLLLTGANNLLINNNSAAAGTTLVIGPNTVIGSLGTGGLVVTGAGTTQISGNFATTAGRKVVGGLTKNGAGKLILSYSGFVPNPYGGDTFVNDGELLLSSGSIQAGTNVTVSGGQFTLGAFAGNTADTAIGQLILSGSGEFAVPSGSPEYHLNQLTMSGGSVDVSGASGAVLHVRILGAGIISSSSPTTASWIGAGTSRIQNDSGFPMAILVSDGPTPSGIDLDSSISLSSAGTNPTFIKDGAGTMRLTSLSNTANIRLATGNLRVDNLATGGVGALGTGAVTLEGGTLVYGGLTATTTKNLTLAANSTIQVLTPDENLTYNGVITETGNPNGLTVLGPGAGNPSSTLTLGNTNAYFGGTTVQQNAILAIPTITNALVVSPIGGDPLNRGIHLGTSNSRGVLMLTGTNPTYSTNRSFYLDGLQANGGGGAIGVQNGGTFPTNLTVTSQITGAGSFIKTGAGTLTLTNTTNNYTGGTYVEEGTLIVGAQGAVIPANSDVTVFADATLQLGAAADNILAPLGTVTLIGGKLRVPEGNVDLYLNKLVMTGGSVDLTTPNSSFLSFTGPGAAIICNASSTTATWVAGSANSFVLNNTSSGIPLTITVARGATANGIDLDAGLSFFGATPAFVKAGFGTMRVTSLTNFASFTVQQGALRVDDVTSNNVGSLGDGNLTLNGGRLAYGGTDATLSKPFTVDASGGGLDIVDADTTLTLTSAVTSNGVLNKIGPGVLILNNLANQYGGGIAVSGGRLDVGDDGQLGVAAVTVNPFGVLRYTASTTVTARTFTLNGGTLQTEVGATVTLNGATVAGGFLRSLGAFNLAGGAALSGVTTFTSNTINQTGPASVANFTNGGSFTIGAGQSLVWNGGTNTSSGRLIVNGTADVYDFVSNGLMSINAGGALAYSSAPLVLGGGSRTFVGSPASPGGAINLGGQTLELNGALLVNNGAITGATNVNFGSLAKGAGSFGAVNIFDGGMFSPGNSPGAATLAAASFNAGGSYLFELSDAAGAPGSGMDFLDISGALSITAGTTPNSQFTIEIVSLDGAGQPGLADNFDPAQSYNFVLATADGGITGFSPNKFKVNAGAFENSPTGGQFSLAQSGNNLLLTFSPGFLAADFDEDHDVDAQDLAKWTIGFGTSVGASHMQGDADGDFDADGADFLTWQRQLGSPAVAAATALVPEPATMLMLVLGTSVMFGRRCGAMS